VKQITVIRKIMKLRGYIVLWQPGDTTLPFLVGSVTPYCGREGFNIGLLKVRAKTTQKDFIEQQKLSKKLAPEHWKWVAPTTWVRRHRSAKPTFWRVTRTRRNRTEQGECEVAHGFTPQSKAPEHKFHNEACGCISGPEPTFIPSLEPEKKCLKRIAGE
jgi:hypothetical protein